VPDENTSLYPAKQTSRLFIDDNFSDLADLIPFIVAKGNDVTAKRKIG